MGQMDQAVTEKKKTWPRYRIPADKRGHRPRLVPGEDTLEFCVALPQSVADKIDRPWSRSIRDMIIKAIDRRDVNAEAAILGIEASEDDCELM